MTSRPDRIVTERRSSTDESSLNAVRRRTALQRESAHWSVPPYTARRRKRDPRRTAAELRDQRRSPAGRDPLGDAGFDPAFGVDQRVGAEPLDRRCGRQDGSRARVTLYSTSNRRASCASRARRSSAPTREARRGHRRSLGGVVQETIGPEGGSPALPGSRPHGLADGGSTVASTGPVMTAPAPESFTGRTRA